MRSLIVAVLALGLAACSSGSQVTRGGGDSIAAIQALPENARPRVAVLPVLDHTAPYGNKSLALSLVLVNLYRPKEQEVTVEQFTGGLRDMLVTESGDELFGRIIGVTENGATLETLGRIRSIPFRGVTALNWQQPSMAVRQLPAIKAGVIARITMQPFVDRPACEPEQFTVTITRSDSMYLVVQHELIGEMKLRWSDISRVDPLFFGQSVLIDARRFHLGNSIRSDFHRHLPDGMRLHGEFSLPTIPPGRPSLSLDVAELEAAGPGTPPASPFLASLRAGNLVTEVIVNDRLLGNLNEQIRFKPPIKTPERIRIAVPREFLKQGQNSFELLQKPLTKGGQEFDDSEIGNIRLDFEFSQD